ncbi:MAG TPA: hypothetical protein VJQ57_14635 [Acidimicrobiia bacterium]|nr:hypothetical protein [Acidimicrobiia bacterium]
MTAHRRRIFLLFSTVALSLLTQVAIAGANVPMSGSDDGTFTVPGPCANGDLNVVITGEGTATHLGRYSYHASECFNPVAGTFVGEPTFIAANGDELWGTYSGSVGGTSDPAVITYSESLIVSGGTGRFVGATGELQVDGLADLATGDYSQTLSGWISNLGLTRGP